ncbi:AraC family transcriptional regulator [Actinophytocola sediminis]
MLAGLRPSTAHFLRAELTAPWGVALPAYGQPTFLFVAAGRCWLRGSGDGRWLMPGDLAVVPHGGAYRIGDQPDRPADHLAGLARRQLGRRSAALRHGGGGAPSLLLWGTAVLDQPDEPLVAQLPSLMVLSGQSAGSLAAAIAHEAANATPGAETVVCRLLDVLIVYAIRIWLRSAPHNGYLGALRDPHLGPVLARMHRDPGGTWSVATMAATAGLSRSVFAERFTATVGRTPMAYLTEIRMRMATVLLTDGLSPGQVAARAGYDSVAAFSRAYKRTTGSSPAVIRRAEHA